MNNMGSKKDIKNKKYLNAYEHNAMWMSYRYAIGRHTAASVMHAGDMVQNVYGRLQPDRLVFDVYDMRREIGYHLQWEFNFDMGLYISREYYDPFKALMEFEKTIPNDEKEIGLLNHLREHRISVSVNNSGKYFFELHEPIHKNELYISHLEDLLIWANAANALDSNKHHQIITDYEGKTETIDAFEIYRINHNLEGNMFCIEYASINDYLENPHKNQWIRKDCIKQID